MIWLCLNTPVLPSKNLRSMNKLMSNTVPHCDFGFEILFNRYFSRITNEKSAQIETYLPTTSPGKKNVITTIAVKENNG